LLYVRITDDIFRNVEVPNILVILS